MKFKVQSLRFKVAALCCAFAVVRAEAATTNTVQTTNALAAVATNTNNPATGTDFPSFKIIAQRNIFSANRSGRVASSGPTRKPTKIETFTLVGTVDYTKGMFAIFDGSTSSFRKTLKVGDSLAGFTIADIDLDHVTIANTNGTDTVLRVGTQMRRVDEGEWALGSGPAPQIAKATPTADSSDDKADAASSEDKSDSSDEAPPSAETNDVLKKLMQKRKAEVKNESPE